MQKSMMALIKDGHAYSQSWPAAHQLRSLFPELKVIAATKLAVQLMPALAVITVAAQLSVLGVSHLPQSLAIAMFFLSLPLQGYYWLGKRANTPLSPSLLHWYRELSDKLAANGVRVPRVSAKPRYQELAQVLKDAFDKMDKAFTEQWF